VYLKTNRNAYIFLKGVFFALIGQSSFEKRNKKNPPLLKNDGKYSND
jgi:hypothetical protein